MRRENWFDQTQFESEVSAGLNELGLFHEIQDRALLGVPDIVFRKEKLAIFLDGCFWHGCPYHWKSPHSNHDYWLTRILRTRERDLAVTNGLATDGWAVLRFWEHEENSSILSQIVARKTSGK